MQVKKYLKIPPKNQLLVNNDRKKLLRESTIFRSIFLCFCPAILSKLLLSWLSLEYILCGLTYFTADDKFGSIQNMFRFNLKVRLFVSRSFRQFPISSSICQVIPACKFSVLSKSFSVWQSSQLVFGESSFFWHVACCKSKSLRYKKWRPASTCLSYGKWAKDYKNKENYELHFGLCQDQGISPETENFALIARNEV